MKKRRTIKEQYKIKSKYKKIKSYILLFLTIFITILLLTNLIWNSNYLKIKKINIKIKNQNILLNSEIQKKINNSISGKIYYFYNKDNIFYLNTQKEENQLKNIFKEIKNIEIKKNIFNQNINILIEEEKPIFNYQNLKGKIFNVNLNGKILNQINKINKNILLTSDTNFLPGELFFKNNEKEQIFNLIHNLNKEKINIKQIKKINSGFWILTDNNNFKLLLKNDFKIEKIISQIKIYKKEKDDFNKLSYMILYFPDKIIYKKK